VDLEPVLATTAYFVVVLSLSAFIAWLLSQLVGQLMKQSTPIVAAQMRRIVFLVVLAVGVIFAIESAGIPSDILLLVVGVAGAGAIVVTRQALENFGARYFSDVYVPFKVGDSISVQGFSGKVIEVNSMATILLGDDDRLVSIPNAALLREVVVNSTPQAWKEVTIPLSVGSDVDLPAFESALLKSVSKLRLRLDKRFPPVLTTKARGPQSTELALTVMIRRPEERDALVSEINKRIAEAMEAARGRKG